MLAYNEDLKNPLHIYFTPLSLLFFPPHPLSNSYFLSLNPLHPFSATIKFMGIRPSNEIWVSQGIKENQLSLPHIQKLPAARMGFHAYLSLSMPGFYVAWSYVDPENIVCCSHLMSLALIIFPPSPLR